MHRIAAALRHCESSYWARNNTVIPALMTINQQRLICVRAIFIAEKIRAFYAMKLLKKNSFSILSGMSLLILLSLYASSTRAETAVAPEADVPNICKGVLPRSPIWLDHTHDVLSTNVCATAVWFDRFFSDVRDEEENADRFIRLVNSFEWVENEGIDFRLKVRARIELPRFKKFGQSLSLIFTGEDEDEVNNVFPEAEQIIEDNPTTRSETRDKRSLSLLWDVKNDSRSAFSIGTSIRLRSRLQPLLNLRYRYTHGIDSDHLIRATQNVFWEQDEGFGERTRLDYEMLLKPESLLRWSASGMYSEKSEGFEWGLGASLFRHLSPKSSVSFDWTTTGDTRPSSEINQHRLGLRYRRNFYRPWLFFEIEPAAFWPIEDDLRLNWGIAFRLEVQLGRKRQSE